MATDSIAAAIRVFQPAAKAIPVAGTILDGVLGSVLELYKVLERVKTNHRQAKDLIDRIGLLSLTIARKSSKGSSVVSSDVSDLQTLLNGVSVCITRLQAGDSKNALIRFAKRVGNADKENEEIQRLDRKVTEAIERFQIATNMEAVNTELRRADDDLQRELHQILRPVHEALYNSHVGPTGCLEGTRAALLEELVEWVFSDGVERALWLCGMAGTGKTAIARTLSELVSERLDNCSGHLVTFFISHDAASRRDPLRILHTLLYFVARANSDFRDYLRMCLCSRPELAVASLDEQTKLLQDCIARCADGGQRIVIVIDALDECDMGQGGDLLRCLLPLLRQTKFHIRLLITAQSETHIEDVFTSISDRRCLRLDDVEPATLRRDIEAYFSHHLASLTRDQIHSLSEKANGLFIYAATLVRFVTMNEFFDEAELLHSLLHEDGALDAESPTPAPDYGPLDAIYLRILRTILPSGGSAHNRQASSTLVRSIVGTLVSIYVPVSPRLLSRLVGRSVQQVEKVLKRLSAVLTIAADGSIRLLHLSFSEFLLDRARCTEPSFHLDASVLVDVHSTALLGTLNIMNADLVENFCHLDTPSQSNSRLRNLNRLLELYVSPDIDYASKYWSAHMKRIPPSPAARAIVATALVTFCRAPVTVWMEVLSMIGYSDLILHALDFATSWWGGELESDDSLNPSSTHFTPSPVGTSEVRDMLRGAVTLIHAIKLRMEDSDLYRVSAPIVMFANEHVEAGRESFAVRLVHEAGRLSPFETYHPERSTLGLEYASITAISGDGKLVAAARESSIFISDGRNGKRIATLTSFDSCPVTELCFSSNGTYLAATSARSPSAPQSMLMVFTFTPLESQNPSTSRWETRMCHLWEDAISAEDRLRAVSSDGLLIALSHVSSSSADGPGWTYSKYFRHHSYRSLQVKYLWSRRTIQLFLADEEAMLLSRVSSCVAFSPDSRALVAAHGSGQISAWNIPSIPTASAHEEGIQGMGIVPPSLSRHLGRNKHKVLLRLWLEFTQDGKTLSCGNDYDKTLTFAVDCSGSNSDATYECLNSEDDNEDVQDQWEPPAHRVRWAYILRE